MKFYFVFVLLLSRYVVLAQTEIPIEINDGGYIFLKVKINGIDTATFMLDTGSGITVFSSNLFNKYKLEAAGLHTGVRHNGESITGMLYKFQNCDGLLSMDYFRNVPFTIDFIHKKLIIETPQSLTAISKQAKKIPIQLKTNGKNELDYFVSICINDSIQALAEFDTGSGFNMLMLNTKYLKKLDIDLSEIKKQDYGYYVYSTTLPELSYCNIESLKQLNVFAGFKDGLIYDALIGSGMFRKSLLTINIPGLEMFVRNK